MARTTFSTSNYINVGSGTTLDNLNIGTILSWGTYDVAATAGTIYSKGATTTRLRFQRGANTFSIEIARATTNLSIQVPDANCTGVGINKWVFMTVAFDLSLTDTDQKLFTGDRVTACAEPSGYTVQQVGSGAKGDDSAGDATIGIHNAAAPVTPWQEALGIVQVVNRYLTLAEVRSWQWYPRYLPGTVGLWVPGWDDGTTVPDWSGNGNAGTLAGATVRAADVPLDLTESLFGDADDDASEPWDWAGAPAAGGGWPDRRRRAAAVWKHLIQG